MREPQSPFPFMALTGGGAKKPRGVLQPGTVPGFRLIESRLENPVLFSDGSGPLVPDPVSLRTEFSPK